jgi:hypothetical protein
MFNISIYAYINIYIYAHINTYIYVYLLLKLERFDGQFSLELILQAKH